MRHEEKGRGGEMSHCLDKTMRKSFGVSAIEVG